MVESKVERGQEVRSWGPRVIWGRIAGVVSPRAPGETGGVSYQDYESEARGYSPVGLHVASGVAIISLRRPEKLNTITAEMWETVTRLVRRLSRDENIRVLVLRGEGKNFSAGSDLKELGSSDLGRVEEIFQRAEECAAAIERSPLPTVACIRGYALGTGLLMALACDVRFASEDATFGMPIARLGITLSEPFVKRLMALTGPSRMKELVYTGRLVGAEEAERIGLVNRIVPEEKAVLHETLETSRVIREQSRASILAAKRWGGSGSGWFPEAYGYVDPEEFPEGVQAFLEKRPPRFYEPDKERKSLLKAVGGIRRNAAERDQRAGRKDIERLPSPNTST